MVTNVGWLEWKGFDDEQRVALARAAVERVRAQGHHLGEPGLVPFGPPDDVHPVALAEDPDTKTTFALVPGGTFAPGLGERGMEAFWSLQRAWLAALQRETAHEMPYTATAWTPEALRRRVRVEIAPMFVAIQPLTAAALGVQQGRFASRPLLRWDEATAAAARLGYEVPSSDELEWATGAGLASLFYWGDALPDPMDPSLEAPRDFGEWQRAADDFAATYMSIWDETEVPWPTSNRFGLQGAAGQPAWCRGDGGEALVAGGAARYFPWQGCGEWLWLLSSLRVPVTAIRGHQGAMLRPILRVPPG